MAHASGQAETPIERTRGPTRRLHVQARARYSAARRLSFRPTYCLVGNSKILLNFPREAHQQETTNSEAGRAENICVYNSCGNVPNLQLTGPKLQDDLSL